MQIPWDKVQGISLTFKEVVTWKLFYMLQTVTDLNEIVHKVTKSQTNKIKINYKLID